jgi:hypothetical protein
MSPWSVVIWPPSVTLASQFVGEATHVFDALSLGSPGSWVPLVFRSANALIESLPVAMPV